MLSFSYNFNKYIGSEDDFSYCEKGFCDYWAFITEISMCVRHIIKSLYTSTTFWKLHSLFKSIQDTLTDKINMVLKYNF